MPPFCAHAENRPRLCEPGAVLNLELFKGEEAVEHDGDLSAGGVALCGEGRLAAGGDAGDDAAADGPLHRRDGEGTDLRLIGVAAQRTGHGRAARVAVQDGCDLLTGDVAIRVKGRGGFLRVCKKSAA